MCGQWRLDQQDLDTYRTDGLLKSPFRIADEQLGRMRDLIHGSNANCSPKRRAGFVIRYMPATSRFERSSGDEHVQSGIAFSMGKRPIWLVRGRDRNGRNDFITGHGQDYALTPRISDEEG